MTANTAESDVGKDANAASADPLALYRRGVDQVNEGRYVEARRTLTAQRTAAEARGELDLGARVAGTTRLSARDLERRRCRASGCAARRWRDPGISSDTIAILYGQLGSIEMSRGRLESASEWLSKSIRGLAHDPLRAANMRMNRGPRRHGSRAVRRGEGRPGMGGAGLSRGRRRAGRVAGGAQPRLRRRCSRETSSARCRPWSGCALRWTAESELWAATNELDRAQALSDAGLGHRGRGQPRECRPGVREAVSGA